MLDFEAVGALGVRKLCVASFVMLALAGCAGPTKTDPKLQSPRPQTAPHQPQAASGRQQTQLASLLRQVEDMQTLINERYLQLAVSTKPEEREALQVDLTDMERQLAQLQQRLADERSAALTNSQAGASPAPEQGGDRYIGPRGGCYKLTRSGRKNYRAC